MTILGGLWERCKVIVWISSPNSNSVQLQLITNHKRITESCVIRIDQGRELLKKQQQQQQQPINVSENNHDSRVV